MGQHGVDHQQHPARDEPGPDGAAPDGGFLRDAHRLKVQRDDRAEVERCQRVHGLIAVQHALCGWEGGVSLGRCAVAGRGRAEDAAREQHHDEHQQGRAEDAAQPLGQLFGLEGHEVRRSKEHEGVDELSRCAPPHQRRQHLKRGAGRAGDSEAGTDGQIDQHSEHLCEAGMDPPGQRRQTARPGHRCHARDGQTDGADGKAYKSEPERRPGLCAEEGREDEVACSEEHREQGEPHQKELFAPEGLSGIVHGHLSQLCAEARRIRITLFQCSVL